MSEIILDEVLALNEELAALADEGVPSYLDSGSSQDSLEEVLKRASNSLSVRSSLGQALPQAAAENQELPPVYRSALEVGLRSNQLSSTLDGLSRQISAQSELRKTLIRSLVPTLILGVIAYFAFVLLCLYYTPALAGMYEQVGQQPSGETSVLVALREWLPYWAILVPLFTLVAMVILRSEWIDWRRVVPGARRYVTSVRDANFAHQLAVLLENNVSLPEGLPLAASVTGDAELIDACTTLTEVRRRNEELTAENDSMSTLPPLLRWAFTGELGDQSLSEVLRFAEKTYRHKAQRQASMWRIVLPTMIGALVGGAIVLVYGLSVFGPFIRLIKDLVG